MAREVELKLQIAAGDAGRLAAWAGAAGPVETQALRAIYFDTPGRSLAKAGLSLRVRHNGKGWVQTIKSGAASGTGLFDRDEWEKPVAGESPELDEETPLAGLPAHTLDAMTPVFSVPVERRTVEVERENGAIEITIDTGSVKADSRSSDFCEAELELKSGDPHGLFALAREIDALVPVRLGVVSKSERGYRLLDAVAEREKAERVSLLPGQSVSGAFGTILMSGIRHYRLNEDILLNRHSPEALHQARVALRRLRSALTIFKDVIEDKQRERFGGELKWLAGELGAVRDLDVLYQKASSGDLRGAIARQRAERYAALDETLRSARARRLMLDLAEWLAIRADSGTTSADTDIEAFAASALDRALKKFKKASADLPKRDDEQRHEARKLAKKLRYATDFFGALYGGGKSGKRYDAFLGRLEIVQETLGDLNDLAAAPHLLDRYGLADIEGAESHAAGEKKSPLVTRASEARDALIGTKAFWR